MKDKLQSHIYKYSYVLELIISFILIIAIGISIITLLNGIVTLYVNRFDVTALKTFLALIFNVIIGIEFLKMLCNPTLDRTIEVLLFSISRQIVIDHMSITDTFIGIFCIVILFIIKRYLSKPILERK